MSKLRTTLHIYLIIDAVVTISTFLWSGLHPSGPACEFFCNQGFTLLQFIFSLAIGIFWPLMLLLYIVTLLGGFSGSLF